MGLENEDITTEDIDAGPGGAGTAADPDGGADGGADAGAAADPDGGADGGADAGAAGGSA